MAVFDLNAKKYLVTEEYNPSAEHAYQEQSTKTQHLNSNTQDLTHTQTQNMGMSPSKTRRGMSPSKRHNASPRKSPSKKSKDQAAEG